MRRKRPTAWIASWFQRGTESANRRARVEDKTSLTLIIQVATLNRLQGQASEAAKAQGLAKTDIAYGDFVADHIGRSLEEAYRPDAARASSGSLGGGDTPPATETHDGPSTEMTFIAVSLSSTVADQLHAQVDEDARSEGIAAGPDHEDFVLRRRGQLLEAPHSRRA